MVLVDKLVEFNPLVKATFIYTNQNKLNYVGKLLALNTQNGNGRDSRYRQALTSYFNRKFDNFPSLLKISIYLKFNRY